MRTIIFSLFLFSFFGLVSGCAGVSGLWTGANLVYDRHGLYKTIDDYQLGILFNQALYQDHLLNRLACRLEIAVFQGDVLVVGRVASEALKQDVMRRLSTVGGYRRLFKFIKVGSVSSSTAQDVWITTQIRSKILADASIDPHRFKIVTSEGIVYILGDSFRDEANKVIAIARETEGVVKVVKLFKYYQLV